MSPEQSRPVEDVAVTFPRGFGVSGGLELESLG